MPMFSLSKGQRQQPPNSAASVGGAPALSAVGAASAETSAAEPATSGTAPSAASIRVAVDARESSAGAVPSDAATETAPSTDGIASPAAPTAREARALASAAGSDGKICGVRGAFTNLFDPGTVCPLEVHYYNGSWLQHGSSSGSSSSSSSNDNTSDHDSWWDVTCVGALLRPFDPGKLCRRSTRRAKVVLGMDLPFDRGKAGGECIMEGDGLRAEGEVLAYIWLVSRTTGEPRVRQNSGRLGC